MEAPFDGLLDKGKRLRKHRRKRVTLQSNNEITRQKNWSTSAPYTTILRHTWRLPGAVVCHNAHGPTSEADTADNKIPGLRVNLVNLTV